jgi:hypothetical protein
MKRLLPSGLILFAGLGIATSLHSEQDSTPQLSRKNDLREALLRKFLKDKKCPDLDYAEVFVAESDAHGLDWRLLPSLAFVESGGGKAAHGNNLFGWAQGKARFNSIGEAIHTVASALAFARPYRGKTLDAKLIAYNPEVIEYPAIVKQVMRQIAPSAQIPAQAAVAAE